MRVRCNLRTLRGTRSLREMEQQCGVSPGILSQIERGVMLPPDRQLAKLEEAYGAPIEHWYGPRVLLELEHDPEGEGNHA